MNIGYFIWDIGQHILTLGTKLFDVFTMEINISWVSNIISLFGGSVNLPENISLYWILGSASAVTLLAIIIYRLFK